VFSAGNINDPISSIALQWKKMWKLVLQAILRAFSGVEHDDKLGNSNPIFSVETQTRNPSSRIETEQRKYFALNTLREIAATCNSIPSSLLRKQFSNAEIRRTRSETMRPEGQVSEAFHTIKLDENSSSLNTFQGPSGHNCYTKMPFGIASGPEEYQRRQHEFLDGL